MTESIFQRYYKPEPLEDRFARDPSGAIDVIIPVLHTNELWHANLISIYRDVPVNRVIISDGGCKDDSIEIARRFPRVTVLDHHEYKSLGFCLRKLIEAVETEWFIYVHSDVYLPEGWFDAMRGHQPTYDWFGCPQRITVQVEYPNVDKMFDEVRPYAGSQMGKKAAFVEGIKKIDDDFVYRQEDYVLGQHSPRASPRPCRGHVPLPPGDAQGQPVRAQAQARGGAGRVEPRGRDSCLDDAGQGHHQVPRALARARDGGRAPHPTPDRARCDEVARARGDGSKRPIRCGSPHIKPWRMRMRKLPSQVVQKLRGLFS